MVETTTEQINCPYAGCSGKWDTRPSNNICPDCGREIRYCQHCGLPNRIFASYCRFCNSKLSIFTSVWPQEGFDSARSFCCYSDRDVAGLNHKWVVRIAKGGDTSQISSVPAPLLAGDIIVYFSEQEESFEARSVFGGGEPVWKCEVFRNSLPLSASPVHIGRYFYFITQDPRYLHRVALDSGRREICSIKLPNKELFEIPGEIYDVCPPIKLSSRGSAAGQISSEYILLVTTEGFLYIFPGSGDGMREPALEGYYFPANFSDIVWHRPVELHNNETKTIVATSATEPKLLFADLSLLPGKQPFQIESLENLRDVDSLSPCVAVPEAGEREFCFLAHSIAKKKTKFIRFRIGEDPKEYKVPFFEEILDAERSETQPITDGSTFFATGRNAEGRWGLSRIYESRADFKEINKFFTLSNCVFVGKDTLLIAGESAPQLTNPQFDEVKLTPKTPYESSAESTPRVRPIVGRDHVFIQTTEFLACYELQR